MEVWSTFDFTNIEWASLGLFVVSCVGLMWLVVLECYNNHCGESF